MTTFHICTLLFCLIIVDVDISYASMCGCKALRPCYKEMVETLKYKNEESCIEDAAIGVSTLLIYLKALKQFCGEIVKVNSESLTFQEKSLYEVVLTLPSANAANAEETLRVKRAEDDAKPVILIEAGQLAGTESVGLALYVIQQLSACEEYKEMLQKVRWVILPCTNPDGMEYARFNRMSWKKNTRVNEGFSFGVDISRNFDAHWGSCAKIESGFSDIYPGETSSSENETMFIKNVLSRYKNDLKGYLSIRRDGHAILYPNGYAKAEHSNLHQLKAIAAEITAKVNQRAGSVQLFMNDSIFNANGMPHCGHSVDFASEEGVSLAYEMRVFLGSDNRIISKFHSLPRGYEGSLRSGYFSGIREFYNAITNEKKFGRIV